MLGSSNKYLGLDIGSSGTKAVLLSMKGGTATVSACDSIDTRDEGILNEAELYHSISQWLSSHGWGACRATVSIPQFLATTLTRDYKSEANKDAVKAMVSFETNQAAGLSDEALVQDFHIFPKTLDRQTPVFIGICREQVVRDRLAALSLSGIKTGDISLSGVAVINAFLHFFPQAAASNSPVLILDLGKESSTAIIMAGGLPLFIGSLLFSGDKFDEAIKEKNTASTTGGKIVVNTGARDLSEVNLMEEIGHSPLLAAARILENEIQNVLESWRAQETEAMASEVIQDVYICGGVSRMKGLREWMEERLETKVTAFGPVFDGEMHPELTVAMGLACQSAGISSVPMSLLPEDLRLKRLREKNWPLLAIALVLVALTCAVGEAKWWHAMSKEMDAYNARNEELEECSSLIGRVKSAKDALFMYEAKMIPLIEAGNQSARLNNAISVMGTACGDMDWFVYLADDLSYKGTNKGNEANKKDSSRNDGGMFSSSTKQEIGDTGGQPEFPVRILPGDIPLSKGYIAAGYTPHLQSQSYELIRKLAAKLEDGKLFKGVDLLPEPERALREDIYQPWVSFLKGVKGQYKAFSFRMPFKEHNVRKPAIPEPKPKKGKK